MCWCITINTNQNIKLNFNHIITIRLIRFYILCLLRCTAAALSKYTQRNGSMDLDKTYNRVKVRVGHITFIPVRICSEEVALDVARRGPFMRPPQQSITIW